jgi:hypothetical protein
MIIKKIENCELNYTQVKYLDYVNNYIDKIGLDDSFNVGSTEEGRWDDKNNGIPYVESIIKGSTIMPIVIVDLIKCQEKTIEDSVDYQYFQSWIDKGFEYLAVDGNNRTITIRKFFRDNLIGLRPNTKYEVTTDSGRIVPFEITNENNTYDTLPSALKDKLANQTLLISVITEASRDSLTNTFRELNSGVAFNKQEQRNSILSPISAEVRKIGYKYDNTVGPVFGVKGKSIIRKHFHEYVVSAMVYYSHQLQLISIADGAKDKAYEVKSLEESNIVPFSKRFNEAMDIIVKNADYSSKVKLTKTNGMNWWMLYNYLKEKNYLIKDKDALWKWFVDSEILRLNSDEFILEKKDSSVTYGGINTDGKNELAARRAFLIKEFLDSDLEKKHVVVISHPERIFNDKQRFALWERQKGICPLSGKIIPVVEILDGSKWEADHIIEWSEGGETTVENGQLICKEAHLQKTIKFNMAS